MAENSDPVFKRVLSRCRLKLMEDMDFESMLDYLITKETIPPNKMRDIMDEKTTNEKIRRLLDSVGSAGESAYRAFLKGLHEINQPHLWQLLMDEENQLMPCPQSPVDSRRFTDAEGMEKWDKKFRKEFTSRSRTIEMRIKNKTPHDLMFVEDYLSTGSWYVSLKPLNIPAYTESVGFAANRSRRIFSGVTGGLAYKFKTNKQNQLYVYIGFTCPFIGKNKTFIGIDQTLRSAKWPYENAFSDNIKIASLEDFRVHAVNTKQTSSLWREFQEMEFIIETDG